MFQIVGPLVLGQNSRRRVCLYYDTKARVLPPSLLENSYCSISCCCSSSSSSSSSGGGGGGGSSSSSKCSSSRSRGCGSSNMY
jgi:hypothetical protein